jgi:ribonuclease HIII
MHQKKIDELIKKNLPELNKHGFTLKGQKEIKYAKKIEIQKEGQPCVIVVYYSPKKGYSFVTEKPSHFSDSAVAILGGEKIGLSKNIGTQDFSNYIGIDESGKGDYFGPLVVAGFFITPEISDELKKLGVKDCKELSKSKAVEIYLELKKNFPDNIITEKLMPSDYNQEYERFYKNGKKLNSLLGSLFAKIIERAYSNHKNIDGVIADKFGDEKYIKEFLNPEYSGNLVCLTKAESYMGVAAASVVARACFILSMEELSLKAGVEIPFGAGANVDKAAKNIYKKDGKNLLRSYVKLHFKNTDKISS